MKYALIPIKAIIEALLLALLANKLYKPTTNKIRINTPYHFSTK
jgi:hypothetical protein